VVEDVDVAIINKRSTSYVTIETDRTVFHR